MGAERAGENDDDEEGDWSLRVQRTRRGQRSMGGTRWETLRMTVGEVACSIAFSLILFRWKSLFIWLVGSDA